MNQIICGDKTIDIGSEAKIRVIRPYDVFIGTQPVSELGLTNNEIADQGGITIKIGKAVIEVVTR